MRNPTHEGLTQYIGGVHRLIRGQPVVLEEHRVKELLQELKDKKSIGLLTVTTMHGAEVDLDTMEAAPLPPSSPKPNFPLDSVSRDDPPPAAALEPLPGTVPITDQSEFKLPPSVGVDPSSPPVTEADSVNDEPKYKKRRR
jgi:hypothetical protein